MDWKKQLNGTEINNAQIYFILPQTHADDYWTNA
jgi:hypothetical protein